MSDADTTFVIIAGAFALGPVVIMAIVLLISEFLD